MKKQSIQIIAKRFFFSNLLAASLFLSASAKTPVSRIHTASYTSSDKVEVKYTGVDANNQLSFNVKYLNPAGSTLTLVVLDEAGETLFKAFYDNRSFNKIFKLPKSEVNKVTFVIEDNKNGVKEKFTVNVKTSVKEEVIVSKG